MSKVVLNSIEYEGVEPRFLDAISGRLSILLHRKRTIDRMPADQILVTSELDRMYGPGLKLKSWYRDYVVQFCRDRKIPCRKEDL
jgi:hypothetical protein